MNTAEEMKKIKADPSYADRLIYPGKNLSEFEGTLKVEVLPSGFNSLDAYKVLKQDRGELILIGARPSQGKSALGFQIATQVAEVGRSHIFSLEMDHESIVARQAAISLKKPLDYIQRYGIPPSEMNAVKGLLERLNCIVDDTPGLTVHQICDRARNQYRRNKTSLIVVDYVQIMGFDKFDPIGGITEASAKLKELSREIRIPVIVLSQLNRTSESREDGTPQLSDLKGSGSLEQDADVVLLIHRHRESPTTARIIIAKNRNGPTGEVELTFAPGQCKFIDVDNNPLD